MALLQFAEPWTLGEQPDAPELNWDDPITQGLLGFVWMGGRGTPRELVPSAAGTYTILQTGTQHLARRGGSASVYDGTAGHGVYTARTAYGSWKPTDAPITFLLYGDHTAPAGSRQYAGTSSSSSGYGVWDLYGARSRQVDAHVGGTRRTAASGTWSSGLAVRGLSATTTELKGWDSGITWATTAYSTTSTLGYDTTYGRLFAYGNPDASSTAGYGYWMALWGRELSAAEHRRIAVDPLCMLVPRTVHVASAAAAGGSVGAADGTSTASAVGASLAAAAGASAGVATASSTGAATTAGAGQADGLAAATATGAALATAAGTSGGLATVAAIGASLAATTGASAGVATAEAAGSSTAGDQGVGAAAGTSTVSAVGASISASIGESAGTSTASAVSSSSSTTETIARPSADVSAGTWVPSTGADLYAMIDETTADAADYISTASPGECRMTLSDTAFPGGATQTVSFQAHSTTSATLTVTLKQGAMVIATWSQALTPTATIYSRQLSAGEIALIASGPVDVVLAAA